MMFFSSAVSPDQDRAKITSSFRIMPRSPWLASLGCTKNAGVPVDDNVAAIVWLTWPDLPMPVTITRPRTLRIMVPLLWPTIVNLVILDFIGKMKQFALVWVMTFSAAAAAVAFVLAWRPALLGALVATRQAR